MNLRECFDDWDDLSNDERVVRLKALFRYQCNAFIDEDAAALILAIISRRWKSLNETTPAPRSSPRSRA